VKPALSKRERKRQNALEEKNKAVALVWWYKLSQAMSHGGGGLKAVMDGDEEGGPEGRRPGASVFSLIQEVGIPGRHASSTQQTRKIVSNYVVRSPLHLVSGW
jgi:hypothetical protein